MNLFLVTGAEILGDKKTPNHNTLPHVSKKLLNDLFSYLNQD